MVYVLHFQKQSGNNLIKCVVISSLLKQDFLLIIFFSCYHLMATILGNNTPNLSKDGPKGTIHIEMYPSVHLLHLGLKALLHLVDLVS